MGDSDEKYISINIRENIKNYIMSKVIESCRKNSNFDFDVKIFMLIVDEKTSK